MMQGARAKLAAAVMTLLLLAARVDGTSMDSGSGSGEGDVLPTTTFSSQLSSEETSMVVPSASVAGLSSIVTSAVESSSLALLMPLEETTVLPNSTPEVTPTDTTIQTDITPTDTSIPTSTPEVTSTDTSIRPTSTPEVTPTDTSIGPTSSPDVTLTDTSIPTSSPDVTPTDTSIPTSTPEVTPTDISIRPTSTPEITLSGTSVMLSPTPKPEVTQTGTRSIPLPTSTPEVTTSIDPSSSPQPETLWDEIMQALNGVLGVVGAAVGVVVVAILFVIVCCICCCCTCKRIRKYRHHRGDVHLNSTGMSFENMGVRNRDFAGENGIIGTRFHKYQAEGSLQDLNYDTIPDRDGGTYLFNETALDADLEFPQQNGGEASQILPSQLSVANTEVFQKSTLPELSPMSYSLTANYPFPLEDSINNLPASTLSLRQPTMFGLSLQNEESKSNQGSKLSIHGSRPSIHGSRPSIHGSRPSIHGSRPSIHESRPSIYSSRTSSIQGGLGSRHGLYNSGTSESLLSGGRFDKEHSIPDDDSNSRDIFTNRFSSPNLVPSNSDSMEVPTRDSSPLSRPLLASSHPLGHGKRDFASLTCIVNPHTSLPPTPEPLDDRDSSLRDNSLLARTKSPTHKKPKRDLTSLTSVPIPEEEEKLKKETKVEESKEESPSTKKGRSKAMSRLEKLTSLDYIRQSFRIKKKKVSFQNVKTPETTPTPTKKGTKKQASPAPTTSSTTPNSNGSTAYPKPAPEKDVDVPQRRTSNASTDIFSPTEESFFRLQQQQQAAQNYMDHMIHMGYAAQLSQPNYFMPHPQYPYPQLSQQYFPPQLSQSYPGHAFSSPYHHVHPEPFRLGQRGAEGHRETAPTGRYQEVITPDFSDITSPDHERYRPPDTQSPQPSDMQGSEYSYDLRPQSPDSLDAKYREREVSPSNYNGTGPPDHYKHRPPTPEHGTYLPGGHHLGMHHPDVVMRSPGHYPYYNHAVDPFLLGSPARYGYGRGQEHDARYPPQPGRRSSGAGFSDGQPGSRRSSGAGFPDGQPGSRRVSGGSMPDGDLAQRRTSIGSIPERHPARTSGGEEPPPGHAYHYAHHNNSNSISVDEPLQNTHRKYSLQSDTSAAETDKKNHVSWSSEVKEYPPHDANTSPSPT